LRCLHTSHAKVIFGRTSVLEAMTVLSQISQNGRCCVVAMAGLEPAT
jgi:hypothetical protein